MAASNMQFWLPVIPLIDVSQLNVKGLSRDNQTCPGVRRTKCFDGLIIPFWLRNGFIDNKSQSSMSASRGIVYGIAIFYLLCGVCIVTNRILAVSFVMASQKRTVRLKSSDGSPGKIVKEPVWHPTVFALTFGVLGSSSLEIFLPVIETFIYSFQGDQQLGPAVVIGTGAFRLLVGTAFALFFSINGPNGKPIKDLYEFITQSAINILAYLWLFLMLDAVSPNLIAIWEGVLTLGFYPFFVLVSWLLARRFPDTFIATIVRRRRVTTLVSHSKQPSFFSSENSSTRKTDSVSPEDEERQRQKLTTQLVHFKENYPELSQYELEELMKEELIADLPKSAPFYRLLSVQRVSITENVVSMQAMENGGNPAVLPPPDNSHPISMYPRQSESNDAPEVRATVDRMMDINERAEFFVPTSWWDQIKQPFLAFTNTADRSSSSPPVALVLGYIADGLLLPWRLLIAVFVPPAYILHGWLAYVMLLLIMVLVSILIGDCTLIFSCSIGSKDSTIAITLIAVGIGLPEVVACSRAALVERRADVVIGHLNRTNTATVFLGLGLAWTIGIIYKASIGTVLYVAAADLSFMVRLYCIFATFVICVMLFRRIPPIGGELGGPTSVRLMCGILFFALWLLFVILSSLNNYCIIGRW